MSRVTSSTRLPTTWLSWRKRRVQALSRSDVPIEIARVVAEKECQLRRCFAIKAGIALARKVDVICVDRGNDIRLALLGGTETMTADQKLQMLARYGEHCVFLLEPKGMHHSV